jgi:pilus assembly protein TadC
MSLFFVNLPFVSALRKLPVVPLPNLLLAKFRPLSDFYLTGTLAWFIAVGLTALILFPNLSNAAIWFLLGTTLIGLSGFIVPQIVFHLLVVRAQSQMADFVHRALRLWDRNPSSLKDLNEALKAHSMWVFDRADITSLLIPELVAAVGLILKSGVVGQHP